MYAIITDRNGHEEARYILSDTDPLDCDVYAQRFANAIGYDLEGEEPTARIPDGCEDYTVTITEEPHAARCWSRANYMIASE
jgi:hypothetical protein